MSNIPSQDIVKIDRKIQTDIFNYNSSEFFINMKQSDIPPKGHPDRADFVNRERDKCRVGLTVGGVYIPGNLYFHFNHFYLIGDDEEDESGRTINRAKIATLRDNDWIIHTEYARAVKEKKGYCLASSRQLGKTSCLTSLTLREVSLYENAEAMLIFGSLADKQSFTKKIKVAIDHGQPYIVRTPIDKDWNNKTEIRFGYTNKDNTTVEKARIFLYNVDGGSDSEKGAGKALVHGSKVYYEDRVGNIEDCKIGDRIYGADGKLTTITGVYPQGVVDLFKITFVDGRTVICCKEHLWTVSTNQYNFQTVDTNHLLTLIKVNDIYLPKVKYTKQLKTLAKKLNTHVLKKHPKIKDIEKVDSNYATCISVDNKDKLFLTNDFIPTHNTVTLFAMDEALKHGSKVYYEDREDVIENVKVGDKIFGKNGELTTVLEVHPQGITDIYKITLKDGRSVESSGNHLWYVYDVGTKKYKTISTEQMFKTNNLKQIDKRYSKIVKKQRYFLPKNDSINYPERSVLIEPYYLGLFLGDGSKSNVRHIANIDEPIINYLKGYAKRLGGELISDNPKSHCIRFKNKEGKIKRYTTLSNYFNHYNLTNNKHIPYDYLYNSKEIRLEVLKGLMDSDGTVYKDGHIEFSNTDYPLIKQVEQLVRSLGINCKLGEAKKAGYKNKNGEFIRCKDSYKLSIRTSVPIFKLERKLNNYNFSDNLKKKSMEELTSILSIEKVENDYSTCIKVDNQDSLFLTNDFIVTHNCGKYPFQSAWEAVEPALKGKNGYRSAPYFSWTGGDTEKAKEAFKFTLNPEASNLLEFETEGKKTSKVMFATYRQDCKIKVPFTTFLDNENIKYDKKNKDLKSIQIEVSDVEEATRKTLKELEDKKKDKDPLASIKHRAYYPLCLKDILAKETKNNFNKEFIDQQLAYLTNVGYDKVEVFRDIKTGEVKHKFTSAPVIEDWRKPIILDAPVKIWDFPKHTEYGVHVIGLDGVREDETTSSDSLAYFTVLRRFHSDLEDPFRGKQVASYLGRKRTVKEMLQLLLDVAEWYNALILYEHVDRSVLDFFESKRKTHLLIDTVPLQREIAVKTKTKNSKGLRPTVANKQFLLNSTLGWVNEDMEDESLGYSRIMDEVLLNQLAEYDPEENLDCYIGFSHAVVAYNYFEKFGVPEVQSSNNKEVNSTKKLLNNNAFGFYLNEKPKSAFGF